MKNKFFLWPIVIFLIAIIATFFIQKWTNGSEFYALYLRTGDLYFGKLVSFPHFGLKQVYLLQVNRDTPETPLSIQRFAKVFWGPEDYVQINRNEVVWMTRLDSKGQLAELIKNNPDLIASPSQATGQNAVPSPEAESSPTKP